MRISDWSSDVCSSDLLCPDGESRRQGDPQLLVHRRLGGVDQAVDLGVGGALEPDRGRLLTDLAGWLAATFGREPGDLARFERALTHGSRTRDNYERLEFLGDRVLGLVIAEDRKSTRLNSSH